MMVGDGSHGVHSLNGDGGDCKDGRVASVQSKRIWKEPFGDHYRYLRPHE